MTADPGRLPNAIEESLRLEPAAAMVDRYATADVTLGDAAIRRGELVSVSVAAANRDPATFPDPDRFDVRRENARQHLAFARGPHVCIGMHLARLEAHTAVGPAAGSSARPAPRSRTAVSAVRAGLSQAACAPRALVHETRLKSGVHQHNSE